MIVMGTGLAVSPFNQMVDSVQTECPKVLINMENTDYSGYDFKSKFNPERLFLKGKCDDIVVKIAKDCGWSEDFTKRIEKSKNQPDAATIDDILTDMEQYESKDVEELKEEDGEAKLAEAILGKEKDQSPAAKPQADAQDEDTQAEEAKEEAKE